MNKTYLIATVAALFIASITTSRAGKGVGDGECVVTGTCVCNGGDCGDKSGWANGSGTYKTAGAFCGFFYAGGIGMDVNCGSQATAGPAGE